jgi:preprotein translocase subunit SecG
VKNASRILKKTFRELLVKSDLTITFLLDVIVCCAILHVILLLQNSKDVEQLLHTRGGHSLMKFKNTCVQTMLSLC